jgi:hypothetical protein
MIDQGVELSSNEILLLIDIGQASIGIRSQSDLGHNSDLQVSIRVVWNCKKDISLVVSYLALVWLKSIPAPGGMLIGFSTGISIVNAELVSFPGCGAEWSTPHVIL